MKNNECYVCFKDPIAMTWRELKVCVGCGAELQSRVEIRNAEKENRRLENG